MARNRVSRRRGGLDNERGVALVAAIFALAIIGALVASGFFAGQLEQQSGRSALFAAQAREAAEAGLIEAAAAVPAEALSGLAVGGLPLDLGTTVIGEGVTARSQVERLTNRLFLIRADGQRQGADGTELATRSLGLLVHVIPPVIAEPANSVAVTRLPERGWVHLY
jgi:hypothetical protein